MNLSKLLYAVFEECEDVAHLREVKAMLGEPGVVVVTLSYYRAMLDSKKCDPRLHDVRQRT